MNLLLHYEYTAHCTEPLSNQVGQDHHWISFCPWAITVPSVDRLSKMTSLKLAQIQGCASYSFYTCSLAEREYLSEDLPHQLFRWPHYLMITANFVQFFSFLRRIFDKRDSFSRADETDRTKTEKSVSFDSTSPPRLTNQRAPRDNQPPTPKFHFLRRRAEAPHVVLYGGFRLTSRRHPKIFFYSEDVVFFLMTWIFDW